MEFTGLWVEVQLRVKQDQRGISNVIVVVLSLVILVTVAANVILWSYEMNQLDWEKMQENIRLTSVTRLTDIWSHSPSGHTLGGSTSNVSGSVLDLTSDDDIYMIHRSYYSGADTSDFVDQTCDLYLPTAKGVHSDFLEQQAGPDSIYDTLTEEDTGGSLNFTLLDDGFEEVEWDANWDDVPHSWLEDNYSVHSGSASAWATNGGEGYFTCGNLNASGVSAIFVDFWFRKDDTEPTDFTLYYFDGSNYDLIGELDRNDGDDTWLHYTEKVTDDQYFVSSFRIRFDATLGWGENVWVDDVLIRKEFQGNDDYELNLEVQWTSADYNGTNEELCIKTGTFSGSEDLQVRARSGGSWVWVMNLTASKWNNVSVTSYLTGSTFTIQILGGTEISDSTQNSWDIDVTLLHVWFDQHTIEVEFTGWSNMEDWTRLNWTVDSAWTIGSVDVTFQLYNYTLDGYPAGGDGYMSYTSNVAANIDETKRQSIDANPTQFRNGSGYWKMRIKGVKAAETQFDFNADWVEIEAVKTAGTLFIFASSSPLTSHLVSLWIINSTVHQHYDISLFVNSGETLSYRYSGINLPSGEYIVKVVTERGNIGVYSGS